MDLLLVLECLFEISDDLRDCFQCCSCASQCPSQQKVVIAVPYLDVGRRAIQSGYFLLFDSIY
jgi:heterodisulfide reductase subunit C